MVKCPWVFKQYPTTYEEIITGYMRRHFYRYRR